MNVTYILIGIIILLVIVVIVLIPFIAIGKKESFTDEPLYTIEDPTIG